MPSAFSPDLDHAHLLVADRLAEVRHDALAHLATTATPVRPRTRRLRLRFATFLRGLACRLDPSPALNI